MGIIRLRRRVPESFFPSRIRSGSLSEQRANSDLDAHCKCRTDDAAAVVAAVDHERWP